MNTGIQPTVSRWPVSPITDGFRIISCVIAKVNTNQTINRGGLVVGMPILKDASRMASPL